MLWKLSLVSTGSARTRVSSPRGDSGAPESCSSKIGLEFLWPVQVFPPLPDDRVVKQC